MKPRSVLRVGFVAACSGFLFGCASRQPYTAAGIQPQEARVLTARYYWQRGVDPERFSDAEIRFHFARTREEPPEVPNGERTELLQARLVLILAAAGDARFAALLSQQPRAIQAAVLRYVEGLWRDERSGFPRLRYPATEALAR